MVRYYGYYSNKSRGLRKKAALDEQVPHLINTDIDSKEFRKSWSRLIQKVYGRDPLACPKCNGKMKVIALIDDLEVIRRSYSTLTCGKRETTIRRPARSCLNLCRIRRSI